MAGDDNPNLNLWNSFQEAFDYFNTMLFSDELPHCILSFKASGKSLGFFHQDKWIREGEDSLSEISLNPMLVGREDDLIFQVLVKNMVSLWQYTHGNPPSRRKYYNTEFTDKMGEVGLPCQTHCGQTINWSIEPGGAYEQARPEAIKYFFPLAVAAPTHIPQRTRIKYHCESCGFTVWAVGGGKLICMTEDCNAEMTKELPN